MASKEIKILNIKIHNFLDNNYIEIIKNFLNTEKQHVIVTPNPEIILAAQKDTELKQIINSADLSLPDGAGLRPASKFKIKCRITGTDTMIDIINLAEQKEYSILFILNKYGLTRKDELIELVKNNYPKLNFTAIYKEEEKEIKPDIIFVALGCPYQEKWIKYNKQNYPGTKIFMTVGGGVDFITGKQKRAPKIFRTLYLEWLWRLIHQPARYKRIFKAIIVFPLKVLFSELS